MTNSTITSQEKQDRKIWLNLRQAIAKSSGFHSWQQERNLKAEIDLDEQVRSYLKETLETLAY